MHRKIGRGAEKYGSGVFVYAKVNLRNGDDQVNLIAFNINSCKAIITVTLLTGKTSKGHQSNFSNQLCPGGA